MGAWGVKIYQDDVAEDVRDEYKEILKKGLNGQEALEEIIGSFIEEIEDIDDGPVFWIALADTMWNMGRLIPDVKEKAIQVIESGADLEKWKENKKEYEKRKEVLEQLKEKLNSPMPAEKKIKIPKIYKCEWKDGDTFAYQLESQEAQEAGIKGKYLILRKVDEEVWKEGDVIPIVYIQITEKGELPRTEKEIEQLPYIICTNKANVKYVYIIDLIDKPNKNIRSKLIYIGNFRDIKPPEDEYKIET